MLARTPADPPATESPRLLRDRNLHVIFSVTLIAILGVASITPAFPRIVRDLGIGTQAVGLLITVFTLPGVILTPIVGVLADRYGRRRVLVPALFLFGVAGGACAFTSDFRTILVLRFLQGIGATAPAVVNVTLIGDLFAGRERAKAMGYNASVLSIGTAAYPAIGGLLATAGWNRPFLLAFLAIPVGLFVLFALDNPEPRNEQRLREYLGGVLHAILRPQVGALFAASVVTFIMLYGAYLTYLPILLAERFGVSTAIIGLVVSSMAAMTAITASQLGRIVRRVPEHVLVRGAFLVYGAALAMIPFVPSLGLFLVPTAIFGIAHGIYLPSAMTLLASYAPLEKRAAFMSINGTVLRAGQTVGPLVMGLAYGVGGIAGVFFAGAAFALAAFVLLAIFLR